MQLLLAILLESSVLEKKIYIEKCTSLKHCENEKDMENFIYFLASLVFYKTIFNFFRMFFVLIYKKIYLNKISNRHHEINKNRKQKSISIIIPLYKEQKIVNQIVTHFNEFLKKNSPLIHIKVFLICTKREDDLQVESTYELLKKAIIQVNIDPRQLILLKTDGTDRCKSDQLNQTLRFIETYDQYELHDTTQYWIGIYDADSLPDIQVIEEVDYFSEQKNIKAMQQTPLYIGRLDRFDLKHFSFNSLYCLSRALYSHIFSFKEGFGYIFSGTRLDFRLHHFTGHGYFIRKDLLDILGGFKAPSCDTILGYRVGFKNEHIQLLCSYDVSEVPDHFKNFFSQGIVWFNGCEKYLEAYLDAKKTNTLKHGILSYLKIIQVFFTNLSWSILPLIWILLILISFYLSLDVFIWAILIWLLFRYLAFFHMISYSSMQIPILYLLTAPLFSMISVPLSCLSPIYYYYCKFFKKEMVLKKTER
jgi:cellulose synthase/poly-beta-1,6-N-acetylglucosamine synthase-like glycosyltransferase